jgi:hypothetical protein
MSSRRIYVERNITIVVTVVCALGFVAILGVIL